MKSTQLYCKNCDHPLEQEHKYCPACGQKANEKLTVAVLFSNTIRNYFSVDARFFASFFPLLFKPGYLPRKFIEGKRLKYLHPAQFYLFVSVVFFFLLSFEARHQQEVFEESINESFESKNETDSIDFKAIDSLQVEFNKKLEEKGITTANNQITQLNINSLSKKNPRKSKINYGLNQDLLDSLIAINATKSEKLKALGYKEDQPRWKKRFYIQLLKFYEKRGGGILQAFFDSIPLAMFILLPIYALLLNLLFLKRGHFAIHLVFSFYFFSFLFTIFSLILLANLLYPLPNWLDWTIILSPAIYLIIALMRFYEQGFIKIFLKTMILSFLYLLFIMPTSFAILALVSFFIY
jgi:hypothetical protein